VPTVTVASRLIIGLAGATKAAQAYRGLRALGDCLDDHSALEQSHEPEWSPAAARSAAAPGPDVGDGEEVARRQSCNNTPARDPLPPSPWTPQSLPPSRFHIRVGASGLGTAIGVGAVPWLAPRNRVHLALSANMT
jgi:hypothetical protein